MAGYNNFVETIGPNFDADPNESVFHSLFREYERVIFKSILSAFWLDTFIKDQYGGDVDTIHNVRRIPEDDRMQYKNQEHENAYDSRGEYSRKDVVKTGTLYQETKKAAKEKYQAEQQTVQDAYEDKPLKFMGKSKRAPSDKNAELDHVISVKSIFDDRGRVLAALTTRDLADTEDNLRWTNKHLNASMKAKEIPEYIEAHMAKKFRKEWEREKSARNAANAYAEAEYYKQKYDAEVAAEADVDAIDFSE